MRNVRRILMSLCVLITFLIGEGLAEVDDWEQAFQLIRSETGYSSHELEKLQMVHSDGLTVFSVMIINHPEDEDGIIVGEMDESGNLLSIKLPEKISLDRQFETEMKNCFNREDSWEALSLFSSKWRNKILLLAEEEKGQVSQKYLKLIDLGITFPSEDSLSCAEAYDIASSHLEEIEGWPVGTSTLFRRWVAAFYYFNEQPVYFFGMERHSYFEKEYESDEAMDKYEQELSEIFARVHQIPPIEIGILADAKTGLLVETPMIDYAPIKYGYLDFLIRDERAVAEFLTEDVEY